ncbi:hypothetical protein M2387_002923 [Klebsiella sp. BIGb0407]|nr:hypothetical protein [Klebsiella sp. BIGb0407]
MLFENTCLVIFYPNDKPGNIRIYEFIRWLTLLIRYIHLLSRSLLVFKRYKRFNCPPAITRQAVIE